MTRDQPPLYRTKNNSRVFPLLVFLIVLAQEFTTWITVLTGSL